MRGFFNQVLGRIRGIFKKEDENPVAKHVDGWDIFNAWVDKIAACKKLTKKERMYILSRIDEKRTNDDGYWNTRPVNLGAMWTWSKEDRKRGVEKASDLGM